MSQLVLFWDGYTTSFFIKQSSHALSRHQHWGFCVFCFLFLLKYKRTGNCQSCQSSCVCILLADIVLVADMADYKVMVKKTSLIILPKNYKGFDILIYLQSC